MSETGNSRRPPRARTQNLWRIPTTPTTGMLLAYLATARVGYGQWIRFIPPLFAALLLLAGGALALAVWTG